MCAPSVTIHCSPVGPSSPTRLLGRLLLTPSERTASPRWWRLSLPTRSDTQLKSPYILFCRWLSRSLFVLLFNICSIRIWQPCVSCIQVLCGKCGNGLGHEFVNDGPEEAISRFWIFSHSLKFVPSKGKMTTDVSKAQAGVYRQVY